MDEDEELTAARVDARLAAPDDPCDSHLEFDLMAREWHARGGDAERVRALLKRSERVLRAHGPDYEGCWDDFEEEDSAWGRLAGCVWSLTDDSAWALALCEESLEVDRYTDCLFDTFAVLSTLPAHLARSALVDKIECADEFADAEVVLDLAVRTGFDAEILAALLAHTLGLIDAALEDAEGMDDDEGIGDDEEGSLDDALKAIEAQIQTLTATMASFPPALPLIEDRAQATQALRKVKT